MDSDMTLVEKIQAGDQNAFSELWSRYKGFAANKSRTMVGNKPAAYVEETLADLLQEVQTQLWQAVMSLKVQADENLKNLSKWVTQVITCKLIDLTKRKRYYREFGNVPLCEGLIGRDMFGWE